MRPSGRPHGPARPAHRRRPRIAPQAPSLLPIRLFLGLGWLRAAVEKLVDPAWWSGAGVRGYVTEQLATGAVTITPYRAVMAGVWRPLATPVGVGVMCTQLLVGLALLVGYRTRVALAAGMALNVAFVLAGSVDPSAFYLVLGLALWMGGPRELPGLDVARAGVWRRREVPVPRPRRTTLVVAIAVLALAAAALLPFVRTLDPAHVVEDPALILLTFVGLATLASTLRRVC